jgi:hypothetical protein
MNELSCKTVNGTREHTMLRRLEKKLACCNVHEHGHQVPHSYVLIGPPTHVCTYMCGRQTFKIKPKNKTANIQNINMCVYMITETAQGLNRERSMNFFWFFFFLSII